MSELETALAIDNILGDVVRELDRATQKFGPFNSTHEGLAVIEEEFEEFKAEVFHGPTKWVLPIGTDASNYSALKDEQRTIRMREEAVQVAAMAVRFILDVCDGKAERR